MPKVIFKIKNLKKWFPVRRSILQILKGEHLWIKAVDGISFTVDKGEIFSLVGPNGAGKTTCIEIMEGLRKKDGGDVKRARAW